jgi:hypothetical protein
LFSITNTLSFIKLYLSALDDQIQSVNPSYKLSFSQSVWLGFILSALLVTNTLCWEVYSRASIGKRKSSALRWMFRHTKLPWEQLLVFSLKALLKRYNITECILVLDDSDIQRSKNTTKLHAVQKLKDKVSGGFIQGQNIVMLLLVTDKITIPVGFDFYQTDPDWLIWKVEDRKLRKSGISKKDRPSEPIKSPRYPSKLVIAANLVSDFVSSFPEITVKALLADCFYGNKGFSDQIKSIDKKMQLISQMRSNQLVKMLGKKIPVETLFERYPGVQKVISLRGEDKIVNMYGMRVQVNSYGCKLMVIALKYEGEDDYRYITATNLSWRTIDVVSAYTLRWLIEVFFQDWKAHEGWHCMATQQGDIGSRRGVVLSLLADHALLLHPEQTNRIDAGLPAVTVGTLSSHVKIEAFLESVKEIINSDHPKSDYEKLSEQLVNLYEFRESRKHLVGLDMSRFESVPALEKRYA